MAEITDQERGLTEGNRQPVHATHGIPTATLPDMVKEQLKPNHRLDIHSVHESPDPNTGVVRGHNWYSIYDENDDLVGQYEEKTVDRVPIRTAEPQRVDSSERKIERGVLPMPKKRSKRPAMISKPKEVPPQTGGAVYEITLPPEPSETVLPPHPPSYSYYSRHLSEGECKSIRQAMEEYPLDPTGFPIIGPGKEVERMQRVIFYLALIGTISPKEHKELNDNYIERGILESLNKWLRRVARVKRFLEKPKGCSLHLPEGVDLEPGEFSQQDLSRRESNTIFKKVLDEKAPLWHVDSDEIICSRFYRNQVIETVEEKLGLRKLK